MLEEGAVLVCLIFLSPSFLIYFTSPGSSEMGTRISADLVLLPRASYLAYIHHRAVADVVVSVPLVVASVAVGEDLKSNAAVVVSAVVFESATAGTGVHLSDWLAPKRALRVD